MNGTLDWGCKLISEQTEFLRATRVLEIGGGDFARSIALARSFPEKQFIAIDFRYDDRAKRNVAEAAVLDNINFLRMDLLDGFLAPDSFDFIFSIAVMEHVPQLEAFLDIVHDLLRPRGTYSFFEAPFWTSRTGHHFNHDDPAVNAILDSYQHIALNEAGMRRYLSGVGRLPFDAETCIRKIYRRPDLSRLSPTETRVITEASKFAVVEWTERTDPDFHEASAAAALAAHGNRYSIADFQIAGVFARLVKATGRPR